MLVTQRPADDGEGNAVAGIIRSKRMTKVMHADFSDADAEARLLPRFWRLGRWVLFVVADDDVGAAFDRRNGLQDGECGLVLSVLLLETGSTCGPRGCSSI